VFPYNIVAYCSICRVDCKFARNKKNIIVCPALCLLLRALIFLHVLVEENRGAVNNNAISLSLVKIQRKIQQK
jgi:hypothetical protein